MPSPADYAFVGLTERQRQVAECAAAGLSWRETAAQLGLSETHVRILAWRARGRLDLAGTFPHGWASFARLCALRRASVRPRKIEYRPE